ncbi:MAG: hypothetical protein ACI4PF_02920 [Christensenellales bacterium]
MKEKQTQEITKENMIRIYDEDLLKRLNLFYGRNKALTLSKNKIFVDLIRLGLDLAEKEEKNRWAFHNETQTIFDSMKNLTKRLNIFLKFSEHFIEEIYAGGQINQDMLCRVYKMLYDKCSDFTKEELDYGDYDFLPELLQEKNERLQADCHHKIAMWKKEKDENTETAKGED